MFEIISCVIVVSTFVGLVSYYLVEKIRDEIVWGKYINLKYK